MNFRFTSSHLFHSIAIISILFAVCFLFDQEEVSSNHVARLLEGDADVRLSHIKAFGQHRNVECCDPQALQYLERCMAAATPTGRSLPTTDEEIESHSGYYSYYITFGLNDGQECTMYCHVSNQDLCMLAPTDPPTGKMGMPNWQAKFSQPMPEKVTQLLAVLTTDDYRLD